MERLTESNPSWIDDELWERACEPDCEEIDAVYRKLKDYEDLEEQDRLLKLPIREGCVSKATAKIVWTKTISLKSVLLGIVRLQKLTSLFF